MVAERSITAKLKLDKSNFSNELKAALAEAKAFERAMSGSGGRSGISSSSGRTIFSTMGEDTDHFTASVNESRGALRGLNVSLLEGGRNGNAFSKGIAASNSRMALLLQYGLAFGPALVPALAAAVPLATALGSGLAFAAVGGATAVLAFQGIGDALKAMNDYAIDPTEAHLQKLKETMDTLGPAGQDFVMFLQELRPEMQQLQNIAQEGMFPGIQEGIDTLLTQMPLVESVISRVSSAMGDLAADTGEALTSPFWIDFFEYIRDDATEIISNFSTGFGKFFEGIAALVLDFAPLTSDIAAGFADMGRSFSEWAQGLPQTQGFQEFLDYLREAGPDVLHTLGLLGKALLDLGVALSGFPAQASLQIINALATVISGLASSPVGPGLLGVAVGLAAVTRAIAAWDTVQASAIMQFLGGRTKGGGIATGPVAKVGGVLGGLLSQKGAIIGAVTLIGASLTDLDESMGVSRALTGAAVGMVFGPWGAAAGTLVGALMDAKHANDEFNESVQHTIDNARTSLDDPLGFGSQQKALDDLIAQRDVIEQMMAAAPAYAGQDSNAAQRLRELNREIDVFTSKQGDVEDVLHAVADAAGPNTWDNYGSGLSRLNSIATDIQPALDHLKISLEDLRNLQTEADGPTGTEAQAELDGIITKIVAFDANARSLEGRTKAVRDAIAAIGGESLSAAADVDALSTALDNLLDPALDAEEAMDALKGQLRSFAAETQAAAGFTGFSEGALKNKAFTRDFVDNLKQVIVTQANAGAGTHKLTQLLMTNREAFIREGIAADFSREEMVARADAIGLTPKMIVTVITQPGMKQAQKDAIRLKVVYDALPESVKTDLIANGIPADATVRSLMRKYQDLSRYDAVTILRARDEASGIVQNLLNKLNSINPFYSTTITTRQNTINTVTDRHLTRNEADGGYIRGPGGPREDKIPAMLSNGEFVVNAAATARNLDLLYQINAEKFANGGIAKLAGGGQPGRRISSGDIGRRSTNLDVTFIDRLSVALGRMRREARDVERAEDAVHHARQRAREATERLEKAEKNEHASKERLRKLQRQVNETTKQQTYEEKQLSKQRDELSKATQKWKDIQGQLLQQAQAASSAVLGQGAIFGGQGTSVSVGGILAKLRQSGKDAQEFNHFINRLRGMGVNERIIQQLLEQGPTPEGLAAARSLAHASASQIQQINRAERQLVGAASQTGSLATRNTQIVNINIKKVETTDIKRLEKALPRRVGRAVRVARSRS